MNPKTSFGNFIAASCGVLYPPLTRDCSTYQFRSATHTELEFHNETNAAISCRPEYFRILYRIEALRSKQ
jgi:hypothetical protein